MALPVIEEMFLCARMFVCVCVFAPRVGDDKIANIITAVYEFPELPVSAVISPVWSSGGAHYRLCFSLRALEKNK